MAIGRYVHVLASVYAYLDVHVYSTHTCTYMYVCMCVYVVFDCVMCTKVNLECPLASGLRLVHAYNVQSVARSCVCDVTYTCVCTCIWRCNGVL